MEGLHTVAALAQECTMYITVLTKLINVRYPLRSFVERPGCRFGYTSNIQGVRRADTMLVPDLNLQKETNEQCYP